MEKLIEYEWPISSGENWFILEHVGNFLSVKSFHRKHKGRIKMDLNDLIYRIGGKKIRI